MKLRLFFGAAILMTTLASAADVNQHSDSRIQEITAFELPQDTTQWAGSIMDLVSNVFSDERDAPVVGKFQELVNWSCGEHADLKAADPKRRAETIKMSLTKLLIMTSVDTRVDYISEQLNRHMKYVPKK